LHVGDIEARHDDFLLRILDCLLRDSTNLGSVGSVDSDLKFRRPPVVFDWPVEVFAEQLRI